MIKQNIRIAIIAILIFLGLWALVCAFIKIDLSSQVLINFDTEFPIVSIHNKDASYIEKYDISNIKIEYEKQYFQSQITYESKNDEYTNYFIYLPPVVAKPSGYFVTNSIIDTVNFYQYLIKK